MDGCNVIATEHGQDMYRNYRVLDLYSMLEFDLCCEILLLLDMGDMDYVLCGRLWREQCLVLCSFGGCGYGNTLLEGFVVCIPYNTSPGNMHISFLCYVSYYIPDLGCCHLHLIIASNTICT